MRPDSARGRPLALVSGGVIGHDSAVTVASHRIVVVSHEHADFDALASLVAACKLHPGSVFVRPSSVGREVHPYLALHKDRFQGVPIGSVRWDEVRELVIVDVRSRSRLGHVAVLLERRQRAPESLLVRVFDHHASRFDDVEADEEVVAPVGSALTLLVELLQEQAIDIDPIEATLFALGIHSDTGSLAFSNTTARDARALACLLERGADVRLVARYLHAPFGRQQREALAHVLAATEVVVHGGLSIGFSAVELDTKASGLDEVTSRAIDILGVAALFVVFGLRPGKTHVVARSASERVDVSRVLSGFGGGGHRSAAACGVHDATVGDVLRRLRTAVESLDIAACIARDVMSSPAYTVAPEMTLEELSHVLDRWRSTGACVVRDGALLGVISRRDVERAALAGRLQLPVSGYMSSRVHTIAPDTSIDEVLRRMEEHDVGRLPVVDRQRLIGLVTRDDALRVLYQRVDGKGEP